MYKETDRTVLTGRVDGNKKNCLRYHQIVSYQSIVEAKDAVVLLSFDCDEGVRRNFGRTGAKDGPVAIKKSLAQIPWHGVNNIQFVDVGTVCCDDGNLEHAQVLLGEKINILLQNRNIPIILGGGHETVYGHYLGVRSAVGSTSKIGIVNIDAHFDMRLDNQGASSGTMFYQILNEDRNANYIVIGIQAFGNTKALFERAQAFQVKYVLEEQLTEQPEEIWKQQIQDFIDKQDVVIVTLCMDVVNASAAPGVSAPSVFGLSPQLVRKLLRYIMQFNKVISFDICEVNPSVDEGERTAKLAANFVNEVVYQLAKKH